MVVVELSRTQDSLRNILNCAILLYTGLKVVASFGSAIIGSSLLWLKWRHKLIEKLPTTCIKSCDRETFKQMSLYQDHDDKTEAKNQKMSHNDRPAISTSVNR